MSDLLREELRTKKRALGHIRLDLAKKGISADPYLRIEEEDLVKEIRAIERELGTDQTPTLAERRAYTSPPHYEAPVEPEPVFQQRMVGQQQRARHADIEHQVNLLAIHRRNLAHYRKQARAYGSMDFAPPMTSHGINEARAGIVAAKRALQQLGQVVDDLPGDE